MYCLQSLLGAAVAVGMCYVLCVIGSYVLLVVPTAVRLICLYWKILTCWLKHVKIFIHTIFLSIICSRLNNLNHASRE